MTVININLEIKERCETLVRLDQIDKNQYAQNKMSFEFLSSEIERNRKESFEIVQEIASEIKKHEDEIMDKNEELSTTKNVLQCLKDGNLEEIEAYIVDSDSLESLEHFLDCQIQFLECDIDDLKKSKNRN